MIYIRVPKEITEYKTRLFLGLTKKQLCYFGIGIVAGILMGLIITPLFGINALAVCITLICIPTVALAFTDKDGIPMDKYIGYILDFYSKKQKISYENDGIYAKHTLKGDDQDDWKQKIKKRRKRKKQQKLLENGSTKKEERKAKRTKHNTVCENVSKRNCGNAGWSI